MNKMMKVWMFFCIITLAVSCKQTAKNTASESSVVKDYLNESKNDFDERMQWWRDARFGMFIHWGVYAVPAGVHNGKETEFIAEWIMNTEHIPIKRYEEYARQFDPQKYDAYRISGARSRRGSDGNAALLYGTNKPSGAIVYYNMKEAPEKGTKVKIGVFDPKAKLIKEYEQEPKKGLNRFNWNMMYDKAEGFKGLIMWAASLRGPMAPPGEYTVKLTVGDQSEEQKFKLLRDPRYPSTDADLKAQFNFLIKVRDKVTETHQAIKDIRVAREQMDQLMSRIKDIDEYKEVKDEGKELMEKMTEIEETLYQTKNQSRQDPLNFPIRLNNKLAALTGVVGSGAWKPTA